MEERSGERLSTTITTNKIKDMKYITFAGTEDQIKNLLDAIEYTSNDLPKQTENSSDKLIKNIDFELLREQKDFILAHSLNIDDLKTHNILEGLLILLDNIQDHAVDNLGVDEREVFNQ